MMPVPDRASSSREPGKSSGSRSPYPYSHLPERKLLMSTMDERTDVRSRTRAGLARLAGPWWIFLLTGIGWLILAWIALRFAPASIPTVGVLLGVYFLVATINEFVIASVMSSWRWLHILMGIIFAFGAGW